MALNARIQVDLQMTESAVLDFGSPSSILAYQKLTKLIDGSGGGAANMRFSDQRILAGFGSENLDFAGGSLIGALGNALTFARLKGVLVYSVTGSVTIARHATTGVPIFEAAGDAIQIPTGGIFLWSSPNAGGAVVTAGTGDMITISAGVSGCTYDIHVWGAAT